MKKFVLACCALLLFQYTALLGQKPKLLLPVVANERVDEVVVSPDGKYLAGSSSGGANVTSEVKVWEIRSNKLIYTLPGNDLNGDQTMFPVFSAADPRKMITCSEDKLKLFVRNIEDGSSFFTITGFKQLIESFGFDHTGNRIIAATADSACMIFDAGSGRPLRNFSLHDSPYPAGISPDDNTLVTCHHGKIKLWDLQAGKLSDEYKTGSNYFSRKDYPVENFCNSLFFSADGKYLVSLFSDSSFYIRDIDKKNEYKLTGEKIADNAYSASGSRLVLLTSAGSAVVYELKTKRIVLEKRLLSFRPQKVSISNLGSTVVIAGEEESGGYSAVLIDVSSGKEMERVAIEWPLLSLKPGFESSGSYFIYEKDEVNRKMIRLLASKQERPYGKALEFSWKSKNITVVPTLQANIMASYSGDSLVQVWDIKQGKIVNSYPLQSGNPVFMNSQYLLSTKDGPEKDYVATIDTVILSDVATGKLLKKYYLKDCGPLFISAGNKYIITGDGIEQPGRVMDIEHGHIIRPIPGLIHSFLNDVSFIPGSDLFLAKDNQFEIKVCNFSNPAKTFTIQNNNGGNEFTDDDWIYNTSFTTDGRLIASVSHDKINIWNSQAGKSIHKITADRIFAVSNFSIDGKQFFYGLEDGTLISANTSDFSIIKKTKVHQSYIYKMVPSKDSRYLLTADMDGMVVIWSANDLLPTAKFALTDAGNIADVDFENGKLYYSTGSLYSCYNLFNGELQYSFANLAQGCIFLLPQNYYQVTRGESISLAWKMGNRVFSFDQFDLRFNRPDIVLKRMGNTDTTLINIYRDAYYKRLKKMNADTGMFNEQYKTPEADFANRATIQYEQNERLLPLHIAASDSNYSLDRFNIIVNGTPVFGVNGINIRQRNTRVLDTTINITLSNGENRLEALVTNANGAENYRYPLYVRYASSSTVTEKIYFVGIGINRFADTSHNLRYCEKDIRDLALKLKEKYGAALQIDTLFNENVTIKKVRALKEKLLQSREDDKVIVAYSGHGLLSKKYDYYLSTYTVNFNQPEENGLPYDELENLVDGIKARKKLMLIDACHSGELDKEEMQKIAAVQATLKDSGITTGSKGIDPSKTNRLGSKNSFELMQELFVNIGRGTGTTVISAATGTQFALERGDLRNGVFTYSILELLNSGTSVTLDELKQHVSRRVSELTRGLQQPTTRNEIQSTDWTIW